MTLCGRAARAFVEFSAEDVKRYQLLFQRTVPDFEPSPAFYALAVQAFEQMRARFAAAGLDDPAQWPGCCAAVRDGGHLTRGSGESFGWLRAIDDVRRLGRPALCSPLP